MIAPLIPYAIRGVIWYQGGNGPEGYTYRTVFPDMIRGWYDHAIIPLPTHPPGQAIHGFSIAGAAGDFRMADARIVREDTVEVWHPMVPEPKYVRFAWHRNPLHNLYNREKLPAVPFRTDQFDLSKKPQ